MSLSTRLGDLDLPVRLVVVSASSRLDGVQIVVDPEVEPLKGVQGSVAYIRQLILNTWRHFREIVTCNEAVTLEIAQRERQHALGDFTDLFSQG